MMVLVLMVLRQIGGGGNGVRKWYEQLFLLSISRQLLVVAVGLSLKLLRRTTRVLLE